MPELASSDNGNES